MKRIDLENLAVMFRCNDPNLGHISTFDAIANAGLAYSYGLYQAIPKRHWRKRHNMREAIASQLIRKAQTV